MPRNHNRITGENITPETIVTYAVKNGAESISYTYTEPTVYFELALDTARIASKQGLKNVFVSNGYMTNECLEEIHPDLHAANLDLKSFDDKFYKEMCGARLEPVLKSIETMKHMGIWVEVTTLIIPGYNDSESALREIAKFLISIDPNIPWHVTRFYPTYRLTNVAITPVKTLQKAREIGLNEGLKYVYTGNIPGHEGENTYCHNCGKLLVERQGFYVSQLNIKDGLCIYCKANIPGIWK